MLADCAPLDAVDARVLLRHALQVDDAYLIAHRDEALTAEQAAAFVSLRARRAAGEPVAYIVGAREFFSLEFKVTPAVLIPRPETELLVEVALERIPENRSARALDLGTGSGCIAIALAKQRPHAEIAAVDRSAAALEVARLHAPVRPPHPRVRRLARLRPPPPVGDDARLRRHAVGHVGPLSGGAEGLPLGDHHLHGRKGA